MSYHYNSFFPVSYRLAPTSLIKHLIIFAFFHNIPLHLSFLPRNFIARRTTYCSSAFHFWIFCPTLTFLSFSFFTTSSPPFSLFLFLSLSLSLSIYQSISIPLTHTHKHQLYSEFVERFKGLRPTSWIRKMGATRADAVCKLLLEDVMKRLSDDEKAQLKSLAGSKVSNSNECWHSLVCVFIHVHVWVCVCLPVLFYQSVFL